MGIVYEPIGVIHSPFKRLDEMPIQPVSAASGAGVVEVFPQFAEGLRDLDGFSHVILLYHFHEARRCVLTVTPFLDAKPHGVFATRAPSRPNPIGLSVVKLISVDHNELRVEQLDVLDGTPVLDIKPYVPDFDQRSGARIGWFEQAKAQFFGKLSDDRFA
jgi:tRNA (adenine37-N6)-methyltransferase